MKKKFLVGFVTGLLLVGMVGVASASILTSDGTPLGNRNDWTGTVGTRFTIGDNDIVINALGFEDVDYDGLGTAHEVGIWSSDGTSLLGSVSVASGTTGIFDDVWRYAFLSADLTLVKNTTYVLGAQTFSNGDFWTDAHDQAAEFALGTGVVAATSFTDANAYATTSLTYPSLNGNGTALRWGPANATYIAPVPEPATMMLFGIGLLGLAGVSRRKK